MRTRILVVVEPFELVYLFLAQTLKPKKQFHLMFHSTLMSFYFKKNQKVLTSKMFYWRKYSLYNPPKEKSFEPIFKGSRFLKESAWLAHRHSKRPRRHFNTPTP